MAEEIKERVWNINLAVDMIRDDPQTYNTLLEDEYKNNTLQLILRRKLNKLCKEGIICKTSIPGTRFGKVIFYGYPKKYHIIVESGRMGSDVYYFFEYEHLSKFYILLKKYWKLEQGKWVECKNKKIFEGNVLLWL